MSANQSYLFMAALAVRAVLEELSNSILGEQFVGVVSSVCTGLFPPAVAPRVSMQVFVPSLHT